MEPFERDDALPAGLPDELFTSGVPVMGPKYERDTTLRLTDDPRVGSLVAFGVSGPFHRLAVNRWIGRRDPEPGPRAQQQDSRFGSNASTRFRELRYEHLH